MMIDLAKLMVLIDKGDSANVIAMKLDVCYQTVRKWTKKLPGDKYWIKLAQNGKDAKSKSYRNFNPM